MSVSRVNKRNPNIRFPEFTHQWQAIRLSEILVPRVNDDSLAQNAPLFSLTIENGVTEKTDRYTRDFLVKDSSDAYKVMKENDFAYNPMNLRFGAIARHKRAYDVKVSKYYDIFSVKNSVDLLFIETMFKLQLSINFYNRMATGSLEEKKRVHFSDFLHFYFPFPEQAEQQKIASFLTSIDDKLTKLRRKRELLEQYKRGLMQQLFSQTIRFKQDDGSEFPEWKQSEFRLLVDRVNTSYNSATECVEYPAIELESIGQGTGEILNIFNSFDQQSTKTLFKQGDVLFGKLRPYLRKFAKPDFDGVCSSEIWVLRGKKITNDFLFFVVQSNRFQKAVNIQSGSKMPRADWNTVADTVFMYPCLEEQQKIADCLSSFDAKIDAVAKQIQQLDTFKKGLLQKMFV